MNVKTIFALILFGFLFSLTATAQDKKDEELAAMFFRERNYEKAASLYEKLYNSNPKYYYYTYYLYSLLELEDYYTAEKLAKKHIRKNKSSRFLVDLGYIYSRSGDNDKAESEYRKALNSLKPNKRDVTDLANGFLTRRQTDYAIKTYLKGRKLLKDEHAFHMEIARAHEQGGDFQAMIGEYLDYIEADPSQVKNVQNRLQSSLKNDRDNTKNEAFREELLRRVQKSPEKIFYSEMLLWYSVQQKDFELALIQAISLDKRMKQDGDKVFEIAQMSTSNNDFDIAREAYEYIVNKGPENAYYLDARIELLNVRFSSLLGTYDYETSQLLGLKKEYIDMIEEYGNNSTTIPLIRNLGHLQAFHLHEIDEAIALLEDAVQLTTISPVQQAECKIELADIMLFSGEVWEATLLYSQVDKAFKQDPLGFYAKYKNARLSFYIGEFDWAKAQLDVLKAATSKKISNDAMDLALLISDNTDMDSTTVALKLYATAELLEYQNRDEEAFIKLDSIETMYTYHALHDEVAYKKAMMFLKRRDYQSADSLLKIVHENFSEDILADNALFKRAKIYEVQLQDKEKAMELYQQVLADYPGSIYVVEARKRFRALRGDNLEQ